GARGRGRRGRERPPQVEQEIARPDPEKLREQDADKGPRDDAEPGGALAAERLFDVGPCQVLGRALAERIADRGRQLGLVQVRARKPSRAAATSRLRMRRSARRSWAAT